MAHDSEADRAEKKRKREQADADKADRRKRRKERKEKSRTGDHVSALQNGASSEMIQSDMAVSSRGSYIPGRSEELMAAWRVSNPMGGRIADIDPIFTPDEQHLILVYNESIQVYSTASSLLLRRIPLKLSPGATIVGACLSEASPNFLWVASSASYVWRIDWNSSSQTGPRHLATGGRRVGALSAAGMMVGEATQDVLFVCEVDSLSHQWSLAAYDAENSNPKQRSKMIFTHSSRLDQLRIADSGRVVVAASGDTIFVGSLKGAKAQSFRDLVYNFYSLSSGDIICSLDVRTEPRRVPAGKGDGGEESEVVDVVVGSVRGAILIYTDIAAKLGRAGAMQTRKEKFEPRKNHWHRRAVYSVKWSRDGNYVISGGFERVLVLWQLDTGKLDFLPHLSALVQNIVVSPSGSSYAVHLDDNSAMILSTADMKPTFYVSGIQSMAFRDLPYKDELVRRIWQQGGASPYPTPAVIDPRSPSTMLMCVGSGHQMHEPSSDSSPSASSPWRQLPSAPLLQQFDLAAFQSVAKQALTRTNAADLDISRDGLPIVEPRVSHLAVSGDGAWLASVDEWRPPRQMSALTAAMDALVGGSTDVDGLHHDAAAASEAARETFLKFWDAASPSDGVALVSRFDDPHSHSSSTAPHSAAGTAAVLALAADPSPDGPPRFATLGADGTVRVWRYRRRVGRDGVPVGAPGLVSWYCAAAAALGGAGSSPQGAGAGGSSSSSSSSSGALAFSQDGSALFVAHAPAASHAEGAAVSVHVLDSASGQVRHRLQNLVSAGGEGTLVVRGLCTLGPNLILLTNAQLVVYDVVADELVYGVVLDGSPGDIGSSNTAAGNGNDQAVDKIASSTGFPAWAAPYFHLAADPRTNTFAIALPVLPSVRPTGSKHNKMTTPRPQGNADEDDQRLHRDVRADVAVFDPESPVPRLVRRLPAAVLNLVGAPTPTNANTTATDTTAVNGKSTRPAAAPKAKAVATAGARGYVVVDALAQVWTVTEAADSAMLMVARPLAEMHLDEPPAVGGGAGDQEDDDGADDDKDGVRGWRLDGKNDGDEEDAEMEEAGVEDQDQAAAAVVVPHQRLAELFDSGLGTAAAAGSQSIEDLFYSVAKLFSPRQVGAAS